MIYLITGLMASGKSTVAQLLAEKLPKAVHLRGDVFRKMIVSGRKEMSASPSKEALAQLDLRYRLTAGVAKEYHQAGFDVVVQDNYYGEKLPYMIKRLSPEPVFTVVLCPDANIIREREENRGKTGYSGFDIETLYQDFMANTPRIGLWIDNSFETPEETASRILKEAHL